MSITSRTRLRAPRPRRATLRRRTRAQALVEFALIVPVFLFVVVVAIDFGRMFFSYVQVNNAAREGAAYGAAVPTDTVGINASVQTEKNVQAQRGEAAMVVTSACADSVGTSMSCAAATGGAGPGNTITVNVSRRFTFLTPLIDGFFGNNLQMTASATATVLGYAPGVGASQPPGCSSPTATFTIVVTSGLSIFANPAGSTPNSGVCNISGYNWDWGDTQANVGTATGDNHTYGAPGTYTVVLEVTNQAGTHTASRTVTVPDVGPTPTPTSGPTPTPGPTASPTPTPAPCSAPVANFTWTTSGNGANRTYTYVDASTVADPVNCPITDWLWTFSNGTSSNAQNPAPFQYGNNSNHPVTLRVTNAAGSTQITKNT